MALNEEVINEKCFEKKGVASSQKWNVIIEACFIQVCIKLFGVNKKTYIIKQLKI